MLDDNDSDSHKENAAEVPDSKDKHIRDCWFSLNNANDVALNMDTHENHTEYTDSDSYNEDDED
ncbi:uncharacterized protein PHACADRAFT_194716 [Phanerochaete carnosa HHB-10118-sp]|uniref:Uncharacterized protein n=1 Tax=Phanerochaete carnosa (strain HHB-10118-sp) TaxID=650164 RepID=K5WCY5_PHACS|nr:uncharacterized protein PHACADRAFT_194716 [Phanerochaete carnosa HHB-10118-sp]EKM57145.1 hypothetical protein PHACADRAFT_194716 [Phanerochaete carnosa HHB-10118-sp]